METFEQISLVKKKLKTVGTNKAAGSERIQENTETPRRKKVTLQLGIMVPYRDREQQLKRFLSHEKKRIYQGY